MTKYVIIALTVVLAAVGAFFVLKRPSPANVSDSAGSDSSAKPEINLPTKPWAEIMKPSVFTVKSDGKADAALETGDEVENGTTIQADRKGLGAIHFPDGSVLRVDSDSKLTVETSSFEQSSEKVNLRVKILNGRLWSKILALVTPDSVWEVKSTNAVATVRGTAFGFAFVGGRSKILGSEDSVTVNVVNPQTDEVVKDAEVKLAPDKYIEIRAEDVKKFIANPKLLQPRAAPVEILSQEWVKRAKAEDQDYNRRLEELKSESGLEGAALRKLWRETIYQEFEDDILRRRKEKEEKRKEEIIKEVPVQPPPPEKPAFQSLQIIAKNSLDKVTEGDQIEIEAVLLLKDGTKKDATAEVSWQVIGPIGKMIKPGLFQAELNPSVAELGQASGTVVATWQDKESGEAYLSKTPIFNVRAKIETPLEREG